MHSCNNECPSMPNEFICFWSYVAGKIVNSFGEQSQFRFDNECYLNLPENHKRVSISGASTSDTDPDAGTASTAIANTTPIASETIDQSIDYASIAALSAFMPNVTGAQLFASSNPINANIADVDEPSFVSVSMLFMISYVLFVML